MKYTRALLLITMAIFTGFSIETSGQLATAGQQNKTEKENERIVWLNFEKFNRGDVGAAAKDWSDDLTNHGEKVGRKGIEMVLEDLIRTFPDAKLEIQNIVAAGETVVVRAIFKGTHRGKSRLPVNGGMLVGVEPTGKQMAVSHMHWFRLRDGKIIEHYATRDDLGMMQQLGLVPVAREVGAR
jgi:predicted ester cyclase